MPATYNKYLCDIVFPPETTAAPPWEAPSDWIDISEVNDNEINLLVADGPGIAFSITLPSGTFSIDWGDGTIETGLTSATVYQHLHSVNGTPSSLGYNTWKIRIFDAGSTITRFKVERHTYTSRAQIANILWAVFGTRFITSYANAFYMPTTVVNCPLLQACVLPPVAVCDSTSYMFNNCKSLLSVTLPSSWENNTNTSYMFAYCTSLSSVVLPSSWGSNLTAAYMFTYCKCLSKVTLPASWGSVASTSNMFTGCSILSGLTLPDSWGSVATTSNMFQYCYALISVNLGSSWGSVSNASYMFNECSALKTVSLPASWGNVSNISNMFQQCYALTSLTLPDSWGSVPNLNNTFNNCSFTTITIPASWGSITSLQNTFSSCSLLKTIVLPSSWGSITSASGLFNGCNSLTAITLPASQSTILTDVSYMFYACHALTAINNLEFLGSNTVACNFSEFMKDCETIQQSIIISAFLSKLQIYTATGYKLKTSSIRLTNPGSTFGGSSPHIDVSYTDLSIAALDLLFGDLPTLTGKTIKITGATGQAGCTRTIATTKGWTVTSA